MFSSRLTGAYLGTAVSGVFDLMLTLMILHEILPVPIYFSVKAY